MPRRARPSVWSNSKLNDMMQCVGARGTRRRYRYISGAARQRRTCRAWCEVRACTLRPGAASPVKKLRIGIIYGGRSGEHEVSIASAASIFKYLDRDRFEPIPIRIEKDGRWLIADRPPTALAASEVIEQARVQSSHLARGGRQAHMVAYPADEPLLTIERSRSNEGRERLRHRPEPRRRVSRAARAARRGRHGAGSARARQPALRRRRRAGLGGRHGQGRHEGGLRGPRPAGHALDAWCCATSGTASATPSPADCAAAFGYPLFVKPANLGSSVGISKAADRRRRSCAAIDLAFEFDRKVLVEQAVPEAREIECAVLGNDDPEASVPGEIVPNREFYDYEAKYLDDQSEIIIPAPLTAEQQDTIRHMAVEAFRAIDARRHGARGLPAVAAHRAALRQRGEHDSRVHDDQHVREAVGRQRPRLSGAARSPHPPGARAPRRQATAAHERGVTPGRAGLVLAALAALAAGAAAAAAPLTESARLAAVYDLILDAAFDAAAAETARACGPAPPVACQLLDVTGVWWRIQLDDQSTALDAEFAREGRRRDCGRDAWTVREPAARRGVVLPRSGVRRPRAVAGAPRRAARGRARRQADQGGARAGARARPIPARRALRHRPLQGTTPTSRRRPRSSSASCCCCPAATGRRGCATCCSHANSGTLLRGEADYQLHWIYFWYEEQPQRGLAVLQDLHARYPHNPLFPQRIAEVAGRVLPRSVGEPRHLAGTARGGDSRGGCMRRRSRGRGHGSARPSGSMSSTKRIGRIDLVNAVIRRSRGGAVRRAGARAAAARAIRGSDGPCGAGARRVPRRDRRSTAARSRGPRRRGARRAAARGRIASPARPTRSRSPAGAHTNAARSTRPSGRSIARSPCGPAIRSRCFRRASVHRARAEADRALIAVWPRHRRAAGRAAGVPRARVRRARRAARVVATIAPARSSPIATRAACSAPMRARASSPRARSRVCRRSTPVRTPR